MELRVTECCKAKGMTLQELAEKLGIARSTLANTLTKKNPTLETLEKIANALEVSIFDLIEESDNSLKHSLTCPKCGQEFEVILKPKSNT